MADITSANSVLSIGAVGLFTIPQQLLGFGTDDAYSMADVDTSEVYIGVDGIMSYGWVPQIKAMKIHMQADSPSIGFWETIYNTQEAAQAPVALFGTLRQPSILRAYTLAIGVMSGYKPIADAKKVLQPRDFSIKWQVTAGRATL